MWQLRYSPPATAGIYRIPRGPAADVTAAIRRLGTNPYVFNAEAVPERANTWLLEVGEYHIVYEILDDVRQVVILRIE
jgi:mRNA-degrading endonuclease RelE of RelBE toxin-antitoxin system